MRIVNLRFADNPYETVFDFYCEVDVSDDKYDDLVGELSDSMASYMENAFNPERKDAYLNAAHEVMNASGYKWKQIQISTILI